MVIDSKYNSLTGNFVFPNLAGIRVHTSEKKTELPYLSRLNVRIYILWQLIHHNAY